MKAISATARRDYHASESFISSTTHRVKVTVGQTSTTFYFSTWDDYHRFYEWVSDQPGVLAVAAEADAQHPIRRSL